MKVLFFASMIVFFLTVSLSCKKNKDDNNLPVHCSDNIKNEDETDVDCGGSCPVCINSAEVSATVNGNTWNCTSYDAYWQSGAHFKLIAKNISGSKSSRGPISSTITIYVQNALEGNQMNLTTAQYISSNGEVFNQNTQTAPSNFIKFSVLDKTNKRASGTFSFTAKSSNNNTTTVTNGQFNYITMQ